MVVGNLKQTERLKSLSLPLALLPFHFAGLDSHFIVMKMNSHQWGEIQSPPILGMIDRSCGGSGVFLAQCWFWHILFSKRIAFMRCFGFVHVFLCIIPRLFLRKQIIGQGCCRCSRNIRCINACVGVLGTHMFSHCLCPCKASLLIQWGRAQKCLYGQTRFHQDLCKGIPPFSIHTPTEKVSSGPETFLSYSLTQLHGGQLRNVFHDDQEIESEALIGMEQQQTEVPVPLVCVLYAVLWGDIEASLKRQKKQSWGIDIHPGFTELLSSTHHSGTIWGLHDSRSGS